MSRTAGAPGRIALAVAVALATGALQAAEPAEIRLVRGGKQQEMPEQARSAIAERLPQLFATC